MQYFLIIWLAVWGVYLMWIISNRHRTIDKLETENEALKEKLKTHDFILTEAYDKDGRPVIFPMIEFMTFCFYHNIELTLIAPDIEKIIEQFMHNRAGEQILNDVFK